MSTKIDFCGATDHDHGGWQVAAADGDDTTTTITMTMAATVTTTVGRGVAVKGLAVHQERWNMI